MWHLFCDILVAPHFQESPILGRFQHVAPKRPYYKPWNLGVLGALYVSKTVNFERKTCVFSAKIAVLATKNRIFVHYLARYHFPINSLIISVLTPKHPQTFNLKALFPILSDIPLKLPIFRLFRPRTICTQGADFCKVVGIFCWVDANFCSTDANFCWVDAPNCIPHAHFFSVVYQSRTETKLASNLTREIFPSLV